jgi:hypothetical protein
MTRTNTPLQALTLLNDRTVLTAARELSHQMLSQPEIPSVLTWLHERVLSRKPTAPELVVLRREWQRAYDHYAKRPNEAAAYLEAAPADPVRLARLAAGCLIATMLMNLDEAITHE